MSLCDTTAASIGVTACLGLICALGAWKAVLVSAGLMIALLTVGGLIDHEIHRRWQRGRKTAWTDVRCQPSLGAIVRPTPNGLGR